MSIAQESRAIINKLAEQGIALDSATKEQVIGAAVAVGKELATARFSQVDTAIVEAVFMVIGEFASILVDTSIPKNMQFALIDMVGLAINKVLEDLAAKKQ